MPSPFTSAIERRGERICSGGRAGSGTRKGSGTRTTVAFVPPVAARATTSVESSTRRISRPPVAVHVGERRTRGARGADEDRVVGAGRRLGGGDRHARGDDRAVEARHEALVASVAVHVADGVPDRERLAGAPLEEAGLGLRVGGGRPVGPDVGRRLGAEEAQAQLPLGTEAPDRDGARARPRARRVARAGDADDVGVAEERAVGGLGRRAEHDDLGRGEAVGLPALDDDDEVGLAVAVHVARADGLHPSRELRRRQRDVEREGAPGAGPGEHEEGEDGESAAHGAGCYSKGRAGPPRGSLGPRGRLSGCPATRRRCA